MGTADGAERSSPDDGWATCAHLSGSDVPDNPPAPDRSAHWHVPGTGHELVVERLVGEGRRVVARVRLAVGLGLALQLGAALERLG